MNTIRKFIVAAAAAALATSLLPPSSFAKAHKAKERPCSFGQACTNKPAGGQQSHWLDDHPAMLLREPQDVCGHLSLLRAGRRVPRGDMQVEEEVTEDGRRVARSCVGWAKAPTGPREARPDDKRRAYALTVKSGVKAMKWMAGTSPAMTRVQSSSSSSSPIWCWA
jgi:hypothetical protein